MKRIHTTTDPTEAELVRARLRDAGIESFLDNQGGAQYAVGLPTSVSPLGVDVADEDASEAADILSRPAAEGEPDPEAPEPLTLDETAAFQAAVEGRRSRWRRWFALVFFGPAVLMTAAWTVSGQWALASSGAIVVLGYLAFGGVIHLLATPAAKEKGPASSSNAGP